jgi:hypothetical protein
MIGVSEMREWRHHADPAEKLITIFSLDDRIKSGA